MQPTVGVFDALTLDEMYELDERLLHAYRRANSVYSPIPHVGGQAYPERDFVMELARVGIDVADEIITRRRERFEATANGS